MTTLREAAQRALEAIDRALPYAPHRSEFDVVADTADDLRAALAEPEEYARANPLGGPAVVFEAIARRLRSGEPYDEVLDDYGLQHIPAALAEPVQEPVGYFSVNDYGRWEENENEYGEPLYAAPPQRKPLSLTDLQEALVYTNLVDRDAIDDPDNYDEGSSLAQIDALHRIIGGTNESA